MRSAEASSATDKHRHQKMPLAHMAAITGAIPVGSTPVTVRDAGSSLAAETDTSTETPPTVPVTDLPPVGLVAAEIARFTAIPPTSPTTVREHGRYTTTRSRNGQVQGGATR